jgi:mannose/cellobiose epimerase-like protein (N-acyl-D-glucosamine 2-epimerase family)
MNMITLSAAREIASEWHGGQGSALYALSSSGTITPGVEWEVGALLRDCEHTVEQRSELEDLSDFAGNYYDVTLGRAVDAAKQDLTLIREQLVHAAPDSVLCDGTMPRRWMMVSKN